MPLRVLALALLGLAAQAPPGDPPAGPPGPAPRGTPPEGPAAPAPPTAAAAKTSPEARELLLRAARRQGTEGLVGGRAPTRFRAAFGLVRVVSPDRKVDLADTTFAFALPAPGGSEARLRNEAAVDGRRTVLGHNGRFGWLWSKDLESGEEEVRRFTDREKDRADIADVEDRRRMLRLALRVFFLGELAEAAVPVRLLPDAEASFPVGGEGRARSVKCRVLERASDPASGEPALRIHLDAETLDPVAVVLLPSKEGESSSLLTLAFETEKVRAIKRTKGSFPPSVRVPDWLELFEVPAAAGEAPSLRIQADLSGFEIDPEKVPDSLFEAPRLPPR